MSNRPKFYRLNLAHPGAPVCPANATAGQKTQKFSLLGDLSPSDRSAAVLLKAPRPRAQRLGGVFAERPPVLIGEAAGIGEAVLCGDLDHRLRPIRAQDVITGMFETGAP